MPKPLSFLLSLFTSIPRLLSSLSYYHLLPVLSQLCLYIHGRTTTLKFYDRPAIVFRISQILIVVVVIQSSKLCFGAEYFGTLAIESLTLHITNLVFHLFIFGGVLWSLKSDRLLLATYLLLGGFFSYILIACYLWKFDLNLHYYFLLSMFVSCYLFDHHQKRILACAITTQLFAFIGLQFKLPSVYTLATIHHANGTVTFLNNISQINAVVFAMASLLCALFIRAILAENWRQLQYYRELQQRLLAKLFPSTIMPRLLASQRKYRAEEAIKEVSVKQAFKHFEAPNKTPRKMGNANSTMPAMQSSSTMGVIFLDICEFTRMAIQNELKPNCVQSNKNESNTIANWQSVYDLFASFDNAVRHIDAKRIKTNGDQYILLVGFESQQRTNHFIAKQTLQACLALRNTSCHEVKIGSALGLVTCGVFDTNHPNFDIWGETVIRAARLEALATADEIVVDTYLQTCQTSSFLFTNKRNVKLKGLGAHQVYNLSGCL